MKIQEHITEKDIFNSVFFKNLVAHEMRKAIENNDLFNDAITFYENLRDSLKKELPFSIKEKLALKIPAYRLYDKITLYPINDEFTQRRGDVLILAANSPKEMPKVSSTTFFDSDKKYLIRILNYKSSAKIYVFGTQEEILKNYKITLFPTRVSYSQKDNSIPLDIDSKVDAEKIKLEFN